ncbi:hypothetical protein KAR91_77275 [Candidatus Pacearchaeota archaeon]|nr:hypothetical protein [Candidatus Pacearchaeota archaeon]
MSGAEAIEILVRANHWQAFLCGSILVGVWTALKHVKTTPHKSYAQARAFLLYVTGFVCIVLIIAEYWVAIAYLLSCMYDIFEYAHESFIEFFEYITD